MNGNNYIWGFFILLLLASCVAKKPITKPKPPSQPPVVEERVRIFDPATGTYILVPKSDVKVDTIEWIADPSAPVITDEDVREEEPTTKGFNIAVFMPFHSSSIASIQETVDPRLNRWLQYYAGMRLAADALANEDFDASIAVFEEDGTTMAQTLNREKQVIAASDVIIGPYEKEGIEKAAKYGLDNEKMVISPWLPAFSVAEENPYFIQLLPGLQSHADALSEYIVRSWPDKKVFVVARNVPIELNRLSLFKKNPDLVVEDLIIGDKSPDLIDTDLKSLFSQKGTVFVLPYYAKSDEAFVNSFLRKLHAEKELEEIIVVGMPQWLGFSNLSSNYMESLSVHASVATFTDTSHKSYEDFRKKFFSAYHIVPDLQAFLGYDLMQWVTSHLMQGGAENLLVPHAGDDDGIASGFHLQPIYRSQAGDGTEMKAPLYYENKSIRIVKYKDLDFQLVK